MQNNKIKWALLILGALIIAVLVCVLIFQGTPSDPNAVGPSSPNATTPPTSQSTPQPTNPDGSIAFPYTIPGTALVIQSVRSYDGVFLEDGSNRDVTGISAMVLVNNGQSGIEYAEITLNQGNTVLRYKATSIPAGATLVVQEATAAKHVNSKYTACSANVAEASTFELSETMVKVEEIENGTLLVTNLTDETISRVRVFYKFAFEKGKIYVGGITYTAELTALEPGQSARLSASHFAAGSSEVIMVRTYETTE